MLTFADIVEAICGTRPGQTHQVVTEAVIDSRKVNPGALFIALPGEQVDGHDFVAEAFERGAVLALIQRDLPISLPVLDLRQECDLAYLNNLELPVCLRVDDNVATLQQIARFWRMKLDVRVIGITGSVGKSTTKELVSEVLDQRYQTLRNPGNLNNEIGLPLSILQLTPDHQRAVLEMGFYVPGEIALLCDIAKPQIGIVTNIGTVHAERAGTQEIIAKGKAELVQALPPAPEGVAILNYDDTLVREMANQTRAQVFFYGLDAHADLWADSIEGLGLDGIRFRLHFRNETIHMRVPLIGRHSVHTALRAAALGLVEGLTWQEIYNGLRSPHTQLRMMTVRTQSGALILDDTYNASPESTLAALNLLDELAGKKIAVLGDMLELGQYERMGHEMVGVRAAEVVDELVTVGVRGKFIAEAAVEAGLNGSAITSVDNCQQAIKVLENRLDNQTTVLVKGSRGMQMDLIVSALEYR
ncbi:MAG TPA: UDP-N-acetylmuramoyl-tripeptide--D-alanyl-D-alanine ligase [Anaerolineales bacterium]|nr:UDP-N-acetylmuramoyl-tripeptide--D-alanyl-D-alanine ligase [Anaerolineales bacterium]